MYKWSASDNYDLTLPLRTKEAKGQGSSNDGADIAANTGNSQMLAIERGAGAALFELGEGIGTGHGLWLDEEGNGEVGGMVEMEGTMVVVDEVEGISDLWVGGTTGWEDGCAVPINVATLFWRVEGAAKKIEKKNEYQKMSNF